jgi:hypothetical protein
VHADPRAQQASIDRVGHATLGARRGRSSPNSSAGLHGSIDGSTLTTTVGAFRWRRRLDTHAGTWIACAATTSGAATPIQLAAALLQPMTACMRASEAPTQQAALQLLTCKSATTAPAAAMAVRACGPNFLLLCLMQARAPRWSTPPAGAREEEEDRHARTDARRLTHGRCVCVHAG